MYGWIGRSRAASRMLVLMSCRNAVLNAAASRPVSGGTSRVLVRPGADAFAMTAMPHELAVEAEASADIIRSLACLLQCTHRLRSYRECQSSVDMATCNSTSRRSLRMRGHAVVNTKSRILFPAIRPFRQPDLGKGRSRCSRVPTR